MKKLILRADSACIITDELTKTYLTETDLPEGTFVLTDEGVLFTDARYYYEVKDSFSHCGIRVELVKEPNTVKDYLTARGIKTLYLDYSRISAKEYFDYQTWGFNLEDASKIIEYARAVKDKRELDLIKSACEIAEKAYHLAIEKVKLGMTERQLKDIIEENLILLGADSVSFDTIVAFGKNSAIPHHVTDDTVLLENVPILVDMGAKVSGYASDITRTAFFGKPSGKFVNSYQAVLKANLTAIEKITDGTKTDVADGYARNVLKDFGIDEYFTHSLGHGVGLEIHEYPTLSKNRSTELKNGMVFTIEPGVYFNGEFGIRIEDTVLLENGKVKRLFSDDKNLLIIKK